MKQIRLKESSFFAKLYQFVYRRDLPMGGCNFFWANIIALIFLVPYTVWCLPSIVVGLIRDRNSSKSKLETWKDDFESFWELMGTNFLLWVALSLVGLYFVGIYHMLTTGIIFTGITVVFWTLNITALAFAIGYLWHNVIVVWHKRRLYKAKLKKALAWNNSLENPTDYFEERTLIWDYERVMKMDTEKVETTSWVSFIISSVKSFYENNCPRIEWIKQ